jgi:hypothetical protein
LKVVASPAAQKVAVLSAAVSTAHRGAVSIASDSPVRPSAVGMNENASRVVRMAAALNATDSLVRAAANSIASDSPGRPTIDVLIVIAMRVVLNDNATSATALRDRRVDTEWIATVSQARRASMVSIVIVTLVRPNVVASMGPGLRGRHVLRSIPG